MKFVRMLPPGSWCNHQAIKDVVKRHFPRARTFVDIGCGAGDLSSELLSMSLEGTGVDFSADAIEQARNNLNDQVKQGRYRLVQDDISQCSLPHQFDFGVANMVMEHVADDVSFVKTCSTLVKPGGHLLFAVPSRMELWSLEDDTVGHMRRYERDTLMSTLTQGGLRNPKVISVAVPLSNWLIGMSKRANDTVHEKAKQHQMSLQQQTKCSGVREIRWKTVFPRWLKLFLNRYTLYPLFVLQRLFYSSNLGVVMIGWGEVPDKG